MKFRIEEAWGVIASTVMEREKLQFDKIKLELDEETGTEDITKEQIMW